MADDNRPTLPSMANLTPTSTPAPRPRRLSLFGPPVAAVEAFAKEMTLINQTPLLALKAVIDLGLELDEPTSSETAAPAAKPPTAPAAELAPERPTPAIGIGLDWQTARDRLIALRRAGESFTSLRDLAARVGCSEGLIRKAIKSDAGLRAWAAEAKRARRTAPAATSLDHAIRRVPQRREAAPDVDAADSIAACAVGATQQAGHPSRRHGAISQRDSRNPQNVTSRCTRASFRRADSSDANDWYWSDSARVNALIDRHLGTRWPCPRLSAASRSRLPTIPSSGTSKNGSISSRRNLRHRSRE